MFNKIILKNKLIIFIFEFKISNFEINCSDEKLFFFIRALILFFKIAFMPIVIYHENNLQYQEMFPLFYQYF